MPEFGLLWSGNSIDSNYSKCLDTKKVQIPTLYLSRKPQITVTGNTGFGKILKHAAGLLQGLVTEVLFSGTSNPGNTLSPEKGSFNYYQVGSTTGRYISSRSHGIFSGWVVDLWNKESTFFRKWRFKEKEIMFLIGSGAWSFQAILIY